MSRVTITNIDKLNQLFNDLKINNDKLFLNAFKKEGRKILADAKTNFRATQKNKSKTNYANFNSYFKISNLRDKSGIKLGVKYYKYRWIDSGTLPRFFYSKKKKNLHKTGSIKATHFYQNAFKKNEAEIESNISKFFIDSFEKTVQKNNAVH
jgi:hypothetical protein